MTGLQAIFKGSEEEALALIGAISRNCTCQKPMGMLRSVCALHLALAHDQKLLDDLLFARWRVAELQAQEFMEPE